MHNLIYNLHSLKSYSVGSNTAYELAIAAAYFIGFLIAFRIFRYIVIARLKAMARKTSTQFDDQLVKVLEHIHPRFYDLVSLYCATQTLSLNDKTSKYIDLAFLVIVIIQVTLCLQEALGYMLSKILRVDTSQPEDQTAFNGIYMLFKIGLWASSLLVILSAFSINISALVASLGIGGIAVALAAQNILNDIFSSFSIFCAARNLSL